jgi:hypothetical protein
VSAEELDRLAGCRRIDRSVVRSCRSTRNAKEFDENLDTQERRGAHPTVVEGVEQRREVGPGKIGRQQRGPIDGLVPLAAEKREVVSQQVRGNALDAVRGALRRALPVFSSEADQQLNERGTLWFQNVEHERDRTSAEHARILTRTAPGPTRSESCWHTRPEGDGIEGCKVWGSAMSGKGLEGEPSIPTESGPDYQAPSAAGVAEAVLDALAGWLAPKRQSHVVRVPELRGMHISETFLPALHAGVKLNMVRVTPHPAPVDGAWSPKIPSGDTGEARRPRVPDRSTPRRSVLRRPSVAALT